MSGFPGPIVPVGHIEPVPRRIRATRHGHVVVDTTDALYVWEWPHYPQYYIPRLDVREDLLVPGPPEVDDSSSRTVRPCSFAGPFADGGAGSPAPTGTVARLIVDTGLAGTGLVGTGLAGTGLAGTVRFDWDALDAWFEEDEEVFVHPRSPYSRVDAPAVDPLRPHRALWCRAGRIVVTGDGLRDRAAHPLLPQPDRGQVRTPRVQSHGHRAARTRGPRRRTGPVWSGARRTPTWPGATTSPPGNCFPSPDWCRSTTRRSTCSSTARRWLGPSPTSATD